MKIVFLCIGSRGDVQPYVALGLELQARGHRAHIITHSKLRGLVESHGIEFTAFYENAFVALESLMKRGAEGDYELQMQEIIDICIKGLDAATREAKDSFRDADVLLSTLLGIAGPHIAEKLDIPFLSTRPQPQMFGLLNPHSYFQPTVSQSRNPLRRKLSLLRRHSHRIRSRAQSLRKCRDEDKKFLHDVNVWRQRELQLPALKHVTVFGDDPRSKTPLLYIYSRHFLPFLYKQKSWHHITGFCELSAQNEEIPTDELRHFLEECKSAGERPIVVCFGSGVTTNIEEFWNRVLDALRQSGQRAIVARGWYGDNFASDDERILVVDSVPLRWLMSHASLLISHGGIGTLSTALFEGVPSVVVPFNVENRFWARAVEAVGAAPKLVRQTNLDVAELTNAIRRAIEEPQFREAATRLQKLLQTENGASNAADIIEAEHARFHAEKARRKTKKLAGKL